MTRLTLILALMCVHAAAYKILVYNPLFGGQAHANYMSKVADVLAEAGHNVTTLHHVLDVKTRSTTTKSRIIRVEPDEAAHEAARSFLDRELNIIEPAYLDPRKIIVGLVGGKMYSHGCRNLVAHDELIEQLRAEAYDVFLTEVYEPCGLGLSHLISPHALITLTTGNFFSGSQYADAGLVFDPAVDTCMMCLHNEPHSFAWRLKNTLGEFVARGFQSGLRLFVEGVFREKYGAEFPSLTDIARSSTFMFTSTEPLLDVAHPTLSRIIDLPCLTSEEPQPLDAFWNEVLSRRSENVLISFGSFVKFHLFNEDVKERFIELTQAFPDVTFIWKHENLDDPFLVNRSALLENVVMTKWMPQGDLLNDKRLTAFITHAGLHSVQEAARRGVPTVLIPMFADHPRNSAMMERNGLGKVLHKHDIGRRGVLIDGLREVLANPAYRENAERMAAIIARKPHSSREQLVKYVEFAAAVGPLPQLMPASVSLNVIQRNNLDVYALIFTVVVLSVYIIVKIVKRLACMRLGGKRKTE